MAVTSATLLTAQTSLQSTSNTADTKADSSSDASAQSSTFGKLLTQKRQTASTDQSSDSQAAAASDHTAQTPANTKDEKTDELQQEVAAALAMLTGMTVPVQIQTQEVQPQVQADSTQAIPAVTTQQTAVQSDMSGQLGQLTQAVVQQPAEQIQPQTAQNTAQQTVPTEEGISAVQVTMQSQTKNTGQDTNSDLTGKQQDDDLLQIRYSDSGQNQSLFQQVEATPVKVGDVPVADTQSPDMDAQIVDEISKTLDAGAQHVEIQLTPENLGTVTIDLTRSQDGSLQVVLHTSTDKAAELLTQHSAALSTLLGSDSQSSVQVKVLQQQEENLYFQQQSQDQSSNGQSGQQQHRQRQESDDFFQQLRLGLIPADEQAS